MNQFCVECNDLNYKDRKEMLKSETELLLFTINDHNACSVCRICDKVINSIKSTNLLYKSHNITIWTQIGQYLFRRSKKKEEKEAPLSYVMTATGVVFLQSLN